MRQFSEQEIQIATQFEQEMRDQGLEIDQNPEATHNGNIVFAQFETQAVTIEGLRKVIEALRPQLKWKSAAQIEYEKEYNRLSKDQQNQFGAWWFSPSTKKTILIEGDEGFSNAAKIIAWMRGKAFDARTFGLAVSNLASSHGLHWATSPQRIDPRQHQDDGQGTGFMPKDSTPEMRGGRKNHAYTSPADQSEKETRSTDNPVSAWESMARSMLSFGTPSQAAAIRETFDKAQAKGKSWREIYSEMQQVRKNYERVTAR